MRKKGQQIKTCTTEVKRGSDQPEQTQPWNFVKSDAFIKCDVVLFTGSCVFSMIMTIRQIITISLS